MPQYTTRTDRNGNHQVIDPTGRVIATFNGADTAMQCVSQLNRS